MWEQFLVIVAVGGNLVALALLGLVAWQIKKGRWLPAEAETLVHFVLKVRNCAPQVEGLIRWVLFWQQIKGMSSLQITVIAFPGEEETGKILERLYEPYRFFLFREGKEEQFPGHGEPASEPVILEAEGDSPCLWLDLRSALEEVSHCFQRRREWHLNV